MVSHDYDFLLALGSNSGDRLALLRKAVEQIGIRLGPVTALSQIFETAPIGAADQMFLNAAVRVSSNLLPQSAMTLLLRIEEDLGRIRTMKWGNRTIDIDILLVRSRTTHGQWSSVAINSLSLNIPHPEMLNRAFVMVPAAEIAGNWLHPNTGRTLTEERTERFDELEPAKGACWSQQSSGIPHDPRRFAPLPTFI